MDGYEAGNLVKMTILVNAENVDALATIVHSGRAETRGRQLCELLKELIPRQRSEEHTSELQSLMRISYAVFCLKKKKKNEKRTTYDNTEENKTRASNI